MNTLDSILPELRSLLPASLRGAYLDGYVQRRRTPMELLLSRSLPNVDVAASTFEDVRSEIRALGMPQWVANRYLAEAEQALAVGHDAREVVAAAKAWLATSIPSGQDASSERRYHVVVVNERTGEKHVVSRPDEPLTHAEGVTFLSKMSNRPGRRNQLEEVVSAAGPDDTCHVCSETGKKSCTACGTELTYMGAHGEGCPRCAEQEMDVVDALAAQEEAIEVERANMSKMQRLRAMAASPPTDLSGWGQRITDLYLIRMRPVKKLFGSRGPTPAQQAEYDAEKKLWESLNRKARAEHKRLLAASNAGLPPPPARPSRRPSLPDPVLTRISDAAYRSEADALADIFNEGAIWQAEAANPDMVGKWRAPGVRLSIFSEARGPGYVVAIATIDDNDVDVEWLSAGLSEATRNEIIRRLRTAALTQSEDSEAPSPLQDLIESTERRALELGAKPARTRSIGRVTSDNPEARRLGEAVRDLRDRSEIDEAIKWLEAGDLNLTFDIGDRTTELESVDKFMTDLWVSILDTASIALGGVRGEGRGSQRVFYVSPDMIFDADSLPFLLQHVNDGAELAGKPTLRDVVKTGRATLRKVPITIVEPGDGDDYSAKVIDQEKLLTNDSMVHANELGAQFIRSLYSHMKSLRDDLERAPKALDDVRKLLYWTGAMLDTPRCQDATHSRALESFEAAKVIYDQARQHVTENTTTSSEIASIKAPLRKAAVSAAKLATDCGEGQVDIFSARPPTLTSPDDMPSRWKVGDHVVGPDGQAGSIWEIEDRGEFGGWTLKLERPGNHYQSARDFRRVWSEQEGDVQAARDVQRTATEAKASRHGNPADSTRERYRREILGLGLPFERENEAMTALDGALLHGGDPEEVMKWAQREKRILFKDDFPRIFVAVRPGFQFASQVPARLADYQHGEPRAGEPAHFGDLPPIPTGLAKEQAASLAALPKELAEALERYMLIIAELGMVRVAMNKWGVWQTPAVLAEVGPANVKIITKNRDSRGNLAEHGSIHTLVRRKDGAILKFGAPPASAVRGNIYKSPNEIAASVNATGPVSRR